MPNQKLTGEVLMNIGFVDIATWEEVRLSAETQFPQDHLSTLEGCYDGALNLAQLLHDHAALLGYYSRFG